MSIPDIRAADFFPLLPAIVMTVGAIVILLTEVFLSSQNRSFQATLAWVSALIGGVFAWQGIFEPSRQVFLGMAVLDPFSALLSSVVCLGVALSVMLSAGFLRHRNAERGEYYALMLFAGAGMSLLAISTELITLFINLEVLSISTYVLTAYLRKGTRHSEAGFKYFILGAFAAALMLYGAALLYGATGTTKLHEMAGPLAKALELQPGLVYCGFGLLAAGFAFKVAAVPFHMWTPDVYEGAPTPVTALMSAGVKVAAFASLVRVFFVLAPGFDNQALYSIFGVLAVLTMVGGNLMALPQRNVKRMLAYSSIAHAGYLLLGVTTLFARSGHENKGTLEITPLLEGGSMLAASDSFKGILLYLAGYTVTAIGAFGVISALERREDEEKGTAWDLERFSGLAQRKPGWALAMALFMLSLGGIPPTVGFLGKLLIFRSAVDAGMLRLAVVGVLASAAGIYYYLRVVVYMYMRPAPDQAVTPERHVLTEFAVVFSTIAVLVFGFLPGPLSSWLNAASVLFSAQ